MMNLTTNHVANGLRQDTIENRISYAHIVCFLVTFPFHRFYSEMVLISFLLHTLIHTRRHDWQRLWRPELLILSSFFLLNLLGIMWTTDRSAALRDLERQLALLLFPVLFLLTHLNLLQYRKPILLTAGITAAGVILYLYADALRIILYNHLPLKTIISSSFIHHNFSEPLGIHATYLSLYVAVSLAVFMYYLPRERNPLLGWVYGFLMLLLLAGLVQLASKAVLLATIFFTFAGVPFFIGDRTARIRFLSIAGVMLVLLLIVILRVQSFEKRYIHEFRNDLLPDNMVSASSESRLQRWQLGLDFIEKKTVLGYGSGMEKKLLQDAYFKRKMYVAYINELNLHNEYLSLWLKTGLLGLLVACATLLMGFFEAVRNRDFIFFAFLSLLSVTFFSENVLDVNKGIFFCAFYFSFLYLSAPVRLQFRRPAGRQGG